MLGESARGIQPGRDRAKRARDDTESEPPQQQQPSTKRKPQPSTPDTASGEDKENVDPQLKGVRASASALCSCATPRALPPVSSPAMMPISLETTAAPSSVPGVAADDGRTTMSQLELVPELQLAKPTVTTIADLPTEVLVLVMNDLCPQDLASCRCVCRLWRACVEQVPVLRMSFSTSMGKLAMFYQLLQRSVEQQCIVDQHGADILAKHTDLRAGMRHLLVDWMLEAAQSFDQPEASAALAVRIVDIYLMVSPTPVMRNRLQLLGAASLWIASKISNSAIYDRMPTANDVCAATDHSITTVQLLHCETEVARALNFRLLLVTAHDIVAECLENVPQSILGLRKDARAREPAIVALSSMGRRLNVQFMAWAMGLPEQSLTTNQVVGFLLDVAMFDQRFTAFAPALIAVSSLHVVFAITAGIMPGNELCAILPEALVAVNPQRDASTAQCVKLFVDVIVDFHIQAPTFLRAKHPLFFC